MIGSLISVTASIRYVNPTVRHHRFELLVADKQPVPMAGQFFKVPSPVEGLGRVRSDAA